MAVGYNPRIVTDGLVLTLDAGNTKSYPGSGTTLTDLSGNGNTGTLTNGPTYSSDDGGSIVFDGSNDYINSIQSSSIQLTDSMTISCWFSPNNFASGRQGLVGRNGLNEYTITLETSGTISFYFASTGQPGDYFNGASFMAFGQTNGVYQNLVFVRDYTANFVYCYKNGTLVSTSSSLAGTSKPTATSGPMTIGVGNGGYFNGSVSNINLYNRALSASEVAQNYNALAPRYSIPSIVSDGLVLNLDAGNYSSYPGSGTTWTDLSGNGNNGTLTNGPTYSSANGGSIVFDGSDDHILGTIPSSTFSGAHSICCWFYRETVTQWAGLFSNNVNTTSCSIFTFISTYNTLGTNQAGVSGASIAVDLGADHLNKWIYAVITYAGATNGSAVNVYAYKNGSLLSATGSLYWNLSTSSSYYIGRHWTNATQILDGFIPQVQVYNRALSASEVAQNYNALKGRYGL
jgi:hypothetical protein